MWVQNPITKFRTLFLDKTPGDVKFKMYVGINICGAAFDKEQI